MEYFTNSQPLDKIWSTTSESVMITPPPKRRRGRPPKVITGEDGQPSPAASLSAAVLKQGTPKASAPLMRVSPTGSARRSSKTAIGSSPFQAMAVNPSPKGGLLMSLSNGTDGSPKGRKKRPFRPRSKSSEMDKTSSVSITSQQKLQMIVKDGVIGAQFSDTSVNPSLLLSSPIPSEAKVKDLNVQFKLPEASKNTTNNGVSNHFVQLVNMEFSSSPNTPNSRFSSIMQSSPLYHGYYANYSSPNTSIIATSPVKYQMKPIEEFKRNFGELPKNPDNSPSQSRPTTPTPLSKSKSANYISTLRRSVSPTEAVGGDFDKENKNYRISLSIDETGQAKITRIPTYDFRSQQQVKPQVESQAPVPKRMKLVRHESLINLHQPSHLSQDEFPNVIQRSHSTTNITFSDNYETFFEPLKMANDSFFNDIGDIGQMENEVCTDNANNQINSFDLLNEENLINLSDENNEEINDEDINFDARKALIKMVRQSV